MWCPRPGGAALRVATACVRGGIYPRPRGSRHAEGPGSLGCSFGAFENCLIQICGMQPNGCQLGLIPACRVLCGFLRGSESSHSSLVHRVVRESLTPPGEEHRFADDPDALAVAFGPHHRHAAGPPIADGAVLPIHAFRGLTVREERVVFVVHGSGPIGSDWGGRSVVETLLASATLSAHPPVGAEVEVESCLAVAVETHVASRAEHSASFVAERGGNHAWHARDHHATPCRVVSPVVAPGSGCMPGRS